MAELIPLIIISLLFLVLSIYLLQGKGGFLIAGYNTMSETEKEKYDEVALCRGMGKLMLAITGCLILFVPGAIFEMDWLFIVGSVLMVAIIAGGLIYMRGGKRYMRD